ERRLEARNYRVSLSRPEVLESMQSSPGSQQITTTQPLRRLLRYTLAYRPRMWLAGSCSVLNKVFDLAPPALFGSPVVVIVQQENSFLSSWGVVDVRHQLIVLSIVTLVVWLLESAFPYAYALLWRNLAQAVQHDLRIDAYGHLQGL